MSNVAERFGRPLHRIVVPSTRLALPFAKVGVEMEVENFKLTPLNTKKLLPNWDMHTDEHSIRNSPMELVTRGGLVGEDLLNEIKLFCDVANKHKFSEGYPRAGLHLHLDVTDMNGNNSTEMLNMMSAYMLFEDAVFGFAGDWRKTCGFCDSWLGSQHDYPSLAALLVGWEDWEPARMDSQTFSKYQALNFLPLLRFGTLEFRHMPMTLDYDRIVDWINICLCFKRFGLQTNRTATDILMQDGPEALINAVFGGYRTIVDQYIKVPDLYEALPDVMSLKLWQVAQPMDPWVGADNPLLADKERNLKPYVKKVGRLPAKKPVRKPLVPPDVEAAINRLRELQGEL